MPWTSPPIDVCAFFSSICSRVRYSWRALSIFPTLLVRLSIAVIVSLPNKDHFGWCAFQLKPRCEGHYCTILGGRTNSGYTLYCSTVVMYYSATASCGQCFVSSLAWRVGSNGAHVVMRIRNAVPWLGEEPLEDHLSATFTPPRTILHIQVMWLTGLFCHDSDVSTVHPTHTRRQLPRPLQRGGCERLDQ